MPHLQKQWTSTCECINPSNKMISSSRFYFQSAVFFKREIQEKREKWSTLSQISTLLEHNPTDPQRLQEPGHKPCFMFTQRCSCSIDRFHVTSPLSKIQNKRATKVFILMRYRRQYIYICLQFYSSIACFVWKLEHFEFQSYGGAWHKATIAFVEKYLPISWFVAFSEVRALGKVLM